MKFALILPLLVACAAPQTTEKRVHDRAGNLQWVYEAKAGIPNGVSRIYYPDGQLKSEGHYLNGQSHGLWVRYDGDGQITDKTVYRNGAVVWSSPLPSAEPPASLLAELRTPPETKERQRREENQARWNATRTWFYDARPPAPTFVHADWRVSRRPLAGARIQIGGNSAAGTTVFSESVFGQIPWNAYAATALLTQARISGSGQELRGRRVLDLGGNRHWDTGIGQIVSRMALSFPVAAENAETALVSAAALPQAPAMASAAVGSTAAVRVGGSWLRRGERMGVQVDLGVDRAFGGSQPSPPTFLHTSIASAYGIRSLYGTLELSVSRRLDVAAFTVGSMGLGAVFRVRGLRLKSMVAVSDDFDLTTTQGVEHEF